MNHVRNSESGVESSCKAVRAVREPPLLRKRIVLCSVRCTAYRVYLCLGNQKPLKGNVRQVLVMFLVACE